MSDEQQRHSHVPTPGGGGWQPIPQGAGLDAEGTTFLQLPPELLAHPGPAGGTDSWGPLAAPGTGYTPPAYPPPAHTAPAADPWQQHVPATAPEPVAEPVPAPAPAGANPWDAYETSYGQHAPGTVDGAAADPYGTHGANGLHGMDVHGTDGHGLDLHGMDAAHGLDAQGTDGHGLDVHGMDAAHGPDVHGTDGHGTDLRHGTDPHGADAQGVGGMADTAEWAMPFAADAGDGVAEAVPGAGATGQWSVPAAGDDAVDESGEYALGGPDVQRGYGLGPVDAVTGTGEHPIAEWTGEAEAADEPGRPAPADGAGAEAPAPAPASVPAPALDAEPQPAAEPEPAPVSVPVPEPRAEAEPEARVEPAAEAESGAQAYAAAGPGADTYPPVDDHGHGHGLDGGLGLDQAHGLPLAHNEHPCASYVLSVNGTERPVTDAWIGESLLYVLRERLGLAGAKDGCSQGECGACSVQVDGRLVASCLVPAATTAGSEIRTVEGLATGGQPSDVQRALAECGAVQCGFCVPGLAMTVHDLLEGNHAPSELETRQAICGNLCRCSGYRGVLDAVRQVADERAAAAAALEEAQEQQQPETDTAHIPHQAGPYGDGQAGPYGDGQAAPYDEGQAGPYGDGQSDPYGGDSGTGRAMA
ncbi:2Fe-2S iron-sulfur cluster binding domain-containing protein [Streptomyces sp. SCA3-4]|uniref:2Fe-2S iron-sulfur cluster-binding protein n=1 Tax=Streptomyces sichuanensis TaxID=2871810 RepID=UPI001CE2BE6C|nr:2Fe-2S iron-sulfur cluster-binding protein [Streptomyces sichuanensis]MCA6095053.1 2Fe-2S iron-sulfur cluster binding domain-containing protein [Streptomyces sichuanensis]